MLMIKLIFFLCAVTLIFSSTLFAQQLPREQRWSLASAGLAQANYSLRSPDQRIEIRIQTGRRLSYSVLLNGKTYLQDATLSLRIDQTTLGLEPKIKGSKQRTVPNGLRP